MKYMGIDFGEKRVGIAVSDDTGKLAFPKAVLENTDTLVKDVSHIAKEEKVEKIIVGESKNFQGEPNKIMVEIEKFAELLNKESGLEIMFEPEFLTSVQAGRWQGKNEMHDASAAAIILQSFLDRNN